MDAKPPLSEREAVRQLKRLASRWPKSLSLFAGGTGQTLWVVRQTESGVPGVVTEIPGIEADGGCWGVGDVDHKTQRDVYLEDGAS